MNTEIHKNVYDRLQYFIKIQKIPNIIFHGASGSGKRTILYNFISDIFWILWTMYVRGALDKN